MNILRENSAKSRLRTFRKHGDLLGVRGVLEFPVFMNNVGCDVHGILLSRTEIAEKCVRLVRHGNFLSFSLSPGYGEIGLETVFGRMCPFDESSCVIDRDQADDFRLRQSCGGKQVGNQRIFRCSESPPQIPQCLVRTMMSASYLLRTAHARVERFQSRCRIDLIAIEIVNGSSFDGHVGEQI